MIAPGMRELADPATTTLQPDFAVLVRVEVAKYKKGCPTKLHRQLPYFIAYFKAGNNFKQLLPEPPST